MQHEALAREDIRAEAFHKLRGSIVFWQQKIKIQCLGLSEIVFKIGHLDLLFQENELSRSISLLCVEMIICSL